MSPLLKAKGHFLEWTMELNPYTVQHQVREFEFCLNKYNEATKSSVLITVTNTCYDVILILILRPNLTMNGAQVKVKANDALR